LSHGSKSSINQFLLKDKPTITELSHTYNVSRKTVHKWLDRYQESSWAGLEELPRAPLHHPNATPPETVSTLIDTRLKHPNWGPKKIIARLEKQYPDQSLAGSQHSG
jgi:transposase-like protein